MKTEGAGAAEKTADVAAADEYSACAHQQSANAALYQLPFGTNANAELAGKQGSQKCAED